MKIREYLSKLFIKTKTLKSIFFQILKKNNPHLFFGFYFVNTLM